MASPRGLAAMLTIAIASVLAIQCVCGEIICENLPTEICAFSVSSAGMRCVLEKYKHGGEGRQQCRTSQVKVGDIAGWIESDRCVEACGVDRSSVGISSDSLMELPFVERLCSAPCYEGCPNILDLYINLAAAEGITLPKLCESLKVNPRRVMFEAFSSGFVASAPGSLPPSSEPTPVPGSEPAPPSEPTPASETAPGSESVPAPAPGSLPPSSEPIPAPGSLPAPPSEPVPAPTSKPERSAAPRHQKKKEDKKNKKKKHQKKNKNHDKKKSENKA